MADNFETLNIRDREEYKFRNTSVDKQVKVGVEVENGPSNPIPVYLTSGGPGPVNEYQSISGVAISTLTTILSYTVPIGQTLNLKQVECGGENVARYDVLVNSTLIARKRTWFSGGLNLSFDFFDYEISASDVLSVKVFHERPMTSNHEARIVGVLE